MDKQIPNKNLNSDSAWHTDALQAIKLDPAVLEVQISDSNMNKPVVDEQKFTEDIASPKSCKFEDMIKLQKAALLSLAPHQFDILLKYAEILRMQRMHSQKQQECAFCKKNGEPASWYTLHRLKDKRGRVSCPVLKVYRCPACGATGELAHTIKYCPLIDRDRWSC